MIKQTYTTESENKEIPLLDQRSTLEILQLMNQLDEQVPQKVKQVLPEIAEAVELFVQTFNN